jgi:sugar phosphate isomerase/epimerase
MSQTDASVQLYTVRDELAIDVPGTIARLAAIGFTAVEPYDLAVFASALAGPAAEYGITSPTAHGSITDAALRGATLAAAEVMQVRTVFEPFQPEDRFATRDGIARLADELNAAAHDAADRGIDVGYHNHWWELEQHIDGRPALLVLADLTEPAVQFEIDAYWVATGGADPVAIIAELGDRVTALHIKDGPLTRDTSLQVPAGAGSLPLDALLAAAPHARRVLEFDAYADDIFDGLAAGLAALKARES